MLQGFLGHQGLRLTFQLTRLVAIDRFEFTSQNKFSLTGIVQGVGWG